jgi:hypothetical protein
MTSPWNKGLTKNTNASVKKISDTFKRKGLDNFYRWRQDARKSGLIPNTSTQLVQNDKLAFLFGLILGDGNISSSRRTELLTITLGTDKPKIWKYASKIVKNVFNKNPTIRKRRFSNCVDIRLYQNNISKRLSVPLGDRANVNISIPNWITDNSDCLKQLIKGLYEAEASYSIHKKTYTYNFSFSNRNVSLLDLVQKYLQKNNFHPERRSYAVRLRRKIEAEKFKEFISFRRYPLV